MVTARKQRSLPVDMLPERLSYNDDGCEVSPRCLECPLPQCKYDDPGWYQEELRRKRDDGVLEAYWRGLNAGEVAEQFGVSARTVHRILSRSRDGATTSRLKMAAGT
jgi:hypothetical protein